MNASPGISGSSSWVPRSSSASDSILLSDLGGTWFHSFSRQLLSESLFSPGSSESHSLAERILNTVSLNIEILPEEDLMIAMRLGEKGFPMDFNWVGRSMYFAYWILYLSNIDSPPPPQYAECRQAIGDLHPVFAEDIGSTPYGSFHWFDNDPCGDVFIHLGGGALLGSAYGSLWNGLNGVYVQHSYRVLQDRARYVGWTHGLDPTPILM